MKVASFGITNLIISSVVLISSFVASFNKSTEIVDQYGGPMQSSWRLMKRLASKSNNDGFERRQIKRSKEAAKKASKKQSHGYSDVSKILMNDMELTVEELDRKRCLKNPCFNAGICQVQPFGSREIFCRCVPGYFGEFCQYDTPECESQPCQHNGECVKDKDVARGFRCRCTLGYSGDVCEVSLNVDANRDIGKPEVVTPIKVQKASMSYVFMQWYFIAAVSVVVFLCLISCYLTLDAEQKVILERYDVLRNHGFQLEIPNAGCFRLGLRKLIYWCCMCWSICPCLETQNYISDVTDEQIPLPMLITSPYPGYIPVPQTSFSPRSGSFTPAQSTYDGQTVASSSLQ